MPFSCDGALGFRTTSPTAQEEDTMASELSQQTIRGSHSKGDFREYDHTSERRGRNPLKGIDWMLAELIGDESDERNDESPQSAG